MENWNSEDKMEHWNSNTLLWKKNAEEFQRERDVLRAALKTRGEEVDFWRAAAGKNEKKYNDAIAGAQGYQLQANQLAGVHAAAIARAVGLTAELENLKMRLLEKDREIAERAALVLSAEQKTEDLERRYREQTCELRVALKPWCGGPSPIGIALTKAEAAAARWERDIVTLKERLGGANEELKDYDVRVGQLQKRIVELEEIKSNQLLVLRKNMKVMEEGGVKFERLQDRVVELEKEKRDSGWSHPETFKALQRRKGKIAELTARNEQLRGKVNNLLCERDSATLCAKQAVKDKDTRIASLESRVADLLARCADWRKRRNSVIVQRDCYCRDLAGQQSKINGLRKNVIRLEKELENTLSMWQQTLESRTILWNAAEWVKNRLYIGDSKKRLKEALREAYIDKWADGTKVVIFPDAVQEMYGALCKRCRNHENNENLSAAWFYQGMWVHTKTLPTGAQKTVRCRAASLIKFVEKNYA